MQNENFEEFRVWKKLHLKAKTEEKHTAIDTAWSGLQIPHTRGSSARTAAQWDRMTRRQWRSGAHCGIRGQKAFNKKHTKKRSLRKKRGISPVIFAKKDRK